MTPLQTKLLKEFRQLFVIHCSDCDILDGMVDANKVMKWLLHALQAQKDEWVKKLAKAKMEILKSLSRHNNWSYEDIVNDIDEEWERCITSERII